MSYSPAELSSSPAEIGLRAGQVMTDLGVVRFYLASEASAAPSALLLHGVGLNSLAWGPILDAARAAGIDTNWLLVDIPGFGDSARLTGPVSLEEVGAAILSVLDSLGMRKPIDIVGHSMGGFLAMDMAGRWPARFQSLVTIAGAYSSVVDSVNHPLRAALASPEAYAAFLGLRALSRLGPFAKPLLNFGATTGLTRIFMRGMTYHPLRTPRSVLSALARGIEPRSFLYAMATGVNYDYRGAWSALPVRTLALFGAKDSLVGARDRDILREVSPTTTIKVVPLTAHFLPFEDPDTVLNEMTTYWRLATGGEASAGKVPMRRTVSPPRTGIPE